MAAWAQRGGRLQVSNVTGRRPGVLAYSLSLLQWVAPCWGVPMSSVDFEKYQCRMSLSLNIYAHVTCQIEGALSHVTIIF